MYKVTKEFRFEMAHVLSNYNGPCGNLHGHSYRCLVTLESDELVDGMVLDLNSIKKLVNENIIDKFDHSVAINANTTDEFEKFLMMLCVNHKKKVMLFPFRTTAENMAKYIYDEINELLNEKDYLKLFKIHCSKIVLYETTTGCAEYSE